VLVASRGSSHAIQISWSILVVHGSRLQLLFLDIYSLDLTGDFIRAEIQGMGYRIKSAMPMRTSLVLERKAGKTALGILYLATNNSLPRLYFEGWRICR